MKRTFLKVIPSYSSSSFFPFEKFFLTGNSVSYLVLLSLHIKFTFASQHSSLCFAGTEILKIEGEREKQDIWNLHGALGKTTYLKVSPYQEVVKAHL